MAVDTLNLNSLRFYTGDGKQIIMQKQYSCQWEIVPADCIYSAFMKNPSGHLEIDQPVDLTGVTSTVLDGYVITNKISDANIREMKNNMSKEDVEDFERFIERNWGKQGEPVLAGTTKRGRKPKAN